MKCNDEFKKLGSKTLSFIQVILLMTLIHIIYNQTHTANKQVREECMVDWWTFTSVILINIMVLLFSLFLLQFFHQLSSFSLEVLEWSILLSDDLGLDGDALAVFGDGLLLLVNLLLGEDEGLCILFEQLIHFRVQITLRKSIWSLDDSIGPNLLLIIDVVVVHLIKEVIHEGSLSIIIFLFDIFVFLDWLWINER